MKIRVAAYFDNKRDSIVVGSGKEKHTSGTVLLRDVELGGNLRGLLIEEHERPIAPKKEIREWSRLNYFASTGYVDAEGTRVTKASAVYMVGKTVYALFPR